MKFSYILYNAPLLTAQSSAKIERIPTPAKKMIPFLLTLKDQPVIFNPGKNNFTG
jgi:hypothetical protein